MVKSLLRYNLAPYYYKREMPQTEQGIPNTYNINKFRHKFGHQVTNYHYKQKTIYLFFPIAEKLQQKAFRSISA